MEPIYDPQQGPVPKWVFWAYAVLIAVVITAGVLLSFF